LRIGDCGLRIEAVPANPQSEIRNSQLGFRCAPLRSHSPGPPNRVEPQAAFVLHAAGDHRVGRVPRRGRGRDPGHERVRARAYRGRDRRGQRLSDPSGPDPSRVHRRRRMEEDPAAADHRARGRLLRGARAARRAGDLPAVRLADPDGGRAVAEPHGGRRPRLRGHAAVRRGAGLRLRGRRAVHRRGRAAAEARRGARVRRGGEAVRHPGSRRGQRHSGPRRAAHHQRRHREEGHGARAVLGRIRHAPAHHLRIPVRTAPDHRDLGQDAGPSKASSRRRARCSGSRGTDSSCSRSPPSNPCTDGARPP